MSPGRLRRAHVGTGIDACYTMRVAVFGGTGLIGGYVCKTLIACGFSVTSVSRGATDDAGTPRRLSERFEGEQWLSQVDWMQADAASDGAAAAALQTSSFDSVVSCIGSGDLQQVSDEAWNGRWAWSQKSIRQYSENYEPNAQVVAAAKAAAL